VSGSGLGGPARAPSAPADDPTADEIREAEIRENMWIEIIRHMERIYADLASTQTAMEQRTQELLEAKEFADNIIRSMVNALVVTDRWGAIEWVNHAALDLFGYVRDDLTGKPLKMLFAEAADLPAHSLPALWSRLMETGAVRDEETVARGRTGVEVPVGFSGSVLHDPHGDIVGVVAVVRDLRETKRLLTSAANAAAAERLKAQELARANRELRSLQDQLIQAEKMSSLGRLSAGIAHELNNPLGGIVVYSHLLLEDTPTDDPRRPNIDRIVRLCLRCREIVQDLLGFARPPKSGEEPLDVNQVLRRTVDVFAGQALFHNVAIEWSLAAEPLMVLGDAGQLQQAFANIVLNAAQAMGGEGRLTIRSEHVEAPGTAPSGGRGSERGSVRITVTDTGPGIAPEDLPNLFEPFFTTKEAGRGTGLGLAITYGIVQRHRGTIEAISEPGEGARFIVALPALPARRHQPAVGGQQSADGAADARDEQDGHD